MVNQDPTLLIILSEITLFLTIVIVGSGIYIFVKRRKKYHELKKLIEMFTNDKGKRFDHLFTLFCNIPNSNNDEIRIICEKIVNAEANYYEHVVEDLYNNSDISATDVYTSLSNLTSPYELLANKENNTQHEDNNPKEAIPDIDDAIDELLSDNSEDSNNAQEAINNDPAYDLSDSDNTIAEIPDELLDANNSNSNNDKTD